MQRTKVPQFPWMYIPVMKLLLDRGKASGQSVCCTSVRLEFVFMNYTQIKIYAIPMWNSSTSRDRDMSGKPLDFLTNHST